LSGRGLCDELITRPEESYRLCCVVVCDLETSRIGASYIYDINHLRVKFGIGCILVRNSLLVFKPCIICSPVHEDETECEGPLLSVGHTTGLLYGTTWAMN